MVATFFCHAESLSAPTQLRRRPASQTVQDHPLAHCVVPRPRDHRARAVVAARSARSHADLHLEHEATPGAHVPQSVIFGLLRADLEQLSSRKDTRRLSPHLYDALKHAVYGTTEFFEGIVYPLLDVSILLFVTFCGASD
jgi:hypothetical protein